MTGGANHRDNIRALTGSRFGLDDVLVNITCRNDDIEQRTLLVAKFFKLSLAMGAVAGDAFKRGLGVFIRPQLHLKGVLRFNLG